MVEAPGPSDGRECVEGLSLGAGGLCAYRGLWFVFGVLFVFWLFFVFAWN